MFNEAQALTVLRAKLQHAGLSRTAVRRIQVVVRREMRLAGAQVFGAAFDGDDVSRFGFRFWPMPDGEAWICPYLRYQRDRRARRRRR